MKFSVSPHIEQVHFPPISEVKTWIAGRTFPQERPLIDLCQAIPDYPPAPQLIDHLRSLLDDPTVAKYSPDEGLPESRTAIAAWLARRYGAGPSAAEVCLTVGASQAFWLALTVLCQAGDEVVVPLPAYFDHPMALATLGVKCAGIPFDPTRGGQPDLERIAAAITSRTRAILLVTPSNPTGAILPAATIRALFELARQRGIALILDETYNAFVPGGAPHDLFLDPHWRDHFIHIASFGKTFALTGYRAGALVASERFLHHALKVQDSMVVCAPHLTQHAIRYGCEELDTWVASNTTLMQRRHDAFRAAFDIAANRFELVASGAFFAWVKHPFPGSTGREVARRLALEANLICLPGEVFGSGLEGYLRLAFGNITEAQIPAAVARFIELS
ncbi:MAG: aminotransferase class I and II [Desulfuromonadales bacterium GWC2_61_20]|nr:MAG: aminotransferase class I and II [Desulfuromonadales bacterium GWC2_61_20]